MAIGIKFDKARAEQVLDCLAHGKPIPPGSARGWTAHDMVALAGTCFLAAMSQGPALYQHTDWSKVPNEHREAVEETLFDDLHAAIEFYGQLSILVREKEYDAKGFAPRCEAVLWLEGGHKVVIPGEGMPRWDSQG